MSERQVKASPTCWISIFPFEFASLSHMQPGTETLTGNYYDGKTSRRHRVSLRVENGIAILTGDIERECPIGALRVSERTRHAARRITFPDGALLEMHDGAAFGRLLCRTGHREGMVVRWQQNWRAAAAAVAGLIVLLALSYFHLLPGAAAWLAKALPESALNAVGQESLAMLDRRMLEPSQLPLQRQRQITERFQALRTPSGSMPTHRILFRASRIGPNALALPSGDIILTDELVALAPHDDAILGVLAHELGHLDARHMMQRLIQTATVAAGAFALFGDTSAVIAQVPAALLHLRYSRDAEREADTYAIALMAENGIDTHPLATLLTRLAQQSGDGPPPYLSSHPPYRERVDAIGK